jgi:hypothetical protein
MAWLQAEHPDGLPRERQVLNRGADWDEDTPRRAPEIPAPRPQ